MTRIGDLRECWHFNKEGVTMLRMRFISSIFAIVAIAICILSLAAISGADAASPQPTGDALFPSQTLQPGWSLFSPDGRFKFIYQTDGNLVLYQQGVPIWNTNTITAPGYAVMQTDGNFVIYWPSGTPYWATNTYGNEGSYLVVQNDGNVVVYDKNNSPLWWTGTCCR